VALTNCKECKKEVSTEAKTCPYCGIDNPGIIDNNNRRVGVAVLVLIIFLCLYLLKRHERVDYLDTGNQNAGISENKPTDSTQSSPEQPKSMEAPAKVVSTPSQQSWVQTTARSPLKQEQPKQEEIGLDKVKNISPASTPQMMVMRMLEYALNDGGLSHESEIQQTKLQIENSLGPVTGNKKGSSRFRGVATICSIW
jgi:hypothetical protein